jgi:hypothetical protein
MLRPRNRHNGHGEPHPEREKEAGILALVRETADGFGQLIADHIKLARVEIVTDAKTWGRGAVVMAVAVGFVSIGYVMGTIAGALALARLWGGPLAFLAVAGFNLLLGLIGVAVGFRRVRGLRPMHEIGNEVTRSVAVLTEAVRSP